LAYPPRIAAADLQDQTSFFAIRQCSVNLELTDKISRVEGILSLNFATPRTGEFSRRPGSVKERIPSRRIEFPYPSKWTWQSSRWTKLNDILTAKSQRTQREKQVKLKVEAKKKNA